MPTAVFWPHILCCFVNEDFSICEIVRQGIFFFFGGGGKGFDHFTWHFFCLLFRWKIYIIVSYLTGAIPRGTCSHWPVLCVDLRVQGLHLLLHPVQAAAPLAGQAARPHQAGEDHLLLLLHPGGGVTIIGLSQGSIFYMLPPPPLPPPPDCPCLCRCRTRGI